MQRREIKATEEQLELTRKEFAAARIAAKPRLELDGAGVSDIGIITGTVRYVGGTEPAFNVEVWLRDSRGSYTSPDYYTLTGNRTDGAFEAIVAPDDIFNRWAFPEMNNSPRLDKRELYVGVTWRDTDDTRHRALWHVAAEGRKRRLPLKEGAKQTMWLQVASVARDAVCYRHRCLHTKRRNWLRAKRQRSVMMTRSTSSLPATTSSRLLG